MGDAAKLSGTQMAGETSDQELVERIIEGERDLYRVLVDRYQGRVFRVAFGLMRNQEDAREVTQEAFIKAYRSLPSFRRDSSFYTWIYRITINLGIDQKRKAYRSRETPLDEGRLHLSDAHQTGPRPLPGPGQSLRRRELAGRIGEAIAELPEDQRQVVLLREVQGLSYKEIAETVGVAEGTVMSRLFYARKKLQVLLEDLR
tara:strand:+ start:2179 stop:2784 length:606 start_codon:yes stop_codon:yes gene_type:complete